VGGGSVGRDCHPPLELRSEAYRPVPHRQRARGEAPGQRVRRDRDRLDHALAALVDGGEHLAARASISAATGPSRSTAFASASRLETARPAGRAPAPGRARALAVRRRPDGRLPTTASVPRMPARWQRLLEQVRSRVRGRCDDVEQLSSSSAQHGEPRPRARPGAGARLPVVPVSSLDALAKAVERDGPWPR